MLMIYMIYLQIHLPPPRSDVAEWLSVINIYNSTGAIRGDLNDNTTGKRERLKNEIEPIKAEHSAATYKNDNKWGARLAIDQDMSTFSQTVYNLPSDNGAWFRVTLGKVYCVKEVVWYGKSGTSYNSYVCAKSGCNGNCNGYCNLYPLTISAEGDTAALSPVSDCIYGDTLQFDTTVASFNIYELAIVIKPGKII